MEDEFLNWLIFDVILKFGEWFIDTLFSVYRALVLIVTLPIWGIPFAIWYFRIYKSKKKEPEIPDTWKQKTMRRFEKVK